MSLDVTTLRSSFELVVEREPELTARFYERLFRDYPQARPLFSRNDPRRQQEMLRDALVAVLQRIEDGVWLESTLKTLGAKHVGYGVTDEMYDWVGASLLGTLADIAGDAWTPTLEAAWTDAFGAIAGLMKAGADEAAA
jgi:hemoglobin-like flavoprotein